MTKKYELTDVTKNVCGVTVHQIRALKDFGDVKAGDLGGWIEKEENLSHEGECWVAGNAGVFGNAWVFDRAKVSDNARVFGDACVSGDARVYGKAQVSGNAEISN